MDEVIFYDKTASTSNKEIDSHISIDEGVEQYKPYKVTWMEITRESPYYDISPEEHLSKKIKHTYMISEEPFILEKSGNKIILSHEKWSLYSEGRNLLEAEIKLIEEAKELSEVFLKIPVSSLDFNAMELRDFLLRVI